jgi:hypothetical protein
LGTGQAAISPARAATWRGREETRNGVLHVVNPATAASGPEVIAAKELWRVGGEGEDELFFGVIAQITSDDENNVYLLDAQLNQVVVLSPEGGLVRTIGREGEGPGEFRRPSDLFFTPDGNVAVVQRMPGKIVLLTPQGEPAGDLPVPEPENGGMQMLAGGQRAGENLVLNVSRFARRDAGFETTTLLVAVGPSGDLRATYLEKRDRNDFAKLVFDEKKMGLGALVWAAGEDGRVFTSDEFEGYRIHVWKADGSLDRVIEREYTPRRRSAKEIERFTPVIRIRQGDRAASPEVKASETDRDIQQIVPRDNGELWVLSSQGAFDVSEGFIAAFDVFDGGGQFTREITLEGEGDYAEDGFYLVKDRLYVVKGLRSARRAMLGAGEGAEPEEDDAEPMAVTCYDIGKPAEASR